MFLSCLSANVRYHTGSSETTASSGSCKRKARGWTGSDSKTGTAWRTRVIFQTNCQTSYAAGRFAQLKEGGYDLWVYHHNDGVQNPRPQHLAWNGLALPPDHPFWHTHYPPNGWGCQCYVTGAYSQRDVKHQDGDPAKSLPSNWQHTNPKTGAPVGIDKGWGYAPGASVANVIRTLAQKTQNWPYTLAKAYMQSMPADQRDGLATAYRNLPSTAADAHRYARRVLDDTTAAIPPYQTLGLATQSDIRQIGKLKGHDVDGYDFALDVSAVKHIQSHHGEGGSELPRGQRAVTTNDYEKLPILLNAPDQIDDAGSDATGKPLVRYQKKVGDESYNAVFEVRKGRKMLVLKSYYISAPKK